MTITGLKLNTNYDIYRVGDSDECEFREWQDDLKRGFECDLAKLIGIIRIRDKTEESKRCVFSWTKPNDPKWTP